MAYLPLANILHYKLRSALSALGIGLAICMLVTLSGLSRGTLNEVADRWESIDADLIVLPRGWGDNASDKSGAGLSDGYADLIRREHAQLIERIVPVFLWPIKLGGQDQMAVGVDPGQWTALTGGRNLLQGRLFDPDNLFASWIEQILAAPPDGNAGPLEIDQADLSAAGHNGLEIVIDTRLATAGGYRVGQMVFAANHNWRIVGIVPAGAMARVFMPRRTAQFLFGSGEIAKSTLMFVKLREGVDIGPAARAIGQTTRQDVVPLSRYRGMLHEKFGIMFLYVDAVNIVALVIAFLFIMITLYMMVMQRTRDIAILKSSGASGFFLLRQVLGEAMLLTAAGAAMGIGLSFLAAWAIESVRPLLTVRISARWLLIAALASAVGATASSLFPAWRASRVDITKALALE